MAWRYSKASDRIAIWLFIVKQNTKKDASESRFLVGEFNKEAWMELHVDERETLGIYWVDKIPVVVRHYIVQWGASLGYHSWKIFQMFALPVTSW